MDKKNREHELSNDWLRLNFEVNYKQFYDQIKGLKASDGYTDVPVGSRIQSTKKWPWKSKDKVPLLKFVQKKSSGCLYCFFSKRAFIY